MLIPFLCTVQGIIGACNLQLLSDQLIDDTCGGVAKPFRVLDPDDHFLGSSSSPDDCIVSVMNSDAIGSNVCCDVSHGGLVIELANPGHQAIFEQDYCCPLEERSILSRYHQEAYEALHPYYMVEIHPWDGSKMLHD